MGHWCLKKSDCMGGWVLSENWFLTIHRYIKWNVPVSIKISNPNLPVFALCEIIQSLHKFIYFVFQVHKAAIIACQTRLQYAISKAMR